MIQTNPDQPLLLNSLSIVSLRLYCVQLASSLSPSSSSRSLGRKMPACFTGSAADGAEGAAGEIGAGDKMKIAGLKKVGGEKGRKAGRQAGGREGGASGALVVG